LLLLGFMQLMLSLALPQLPFFFTLTSVSLGLGVSILVGLIAGALPAYQASHLPPIEALRAEYLYLRERSILILVKFSVDWSLAG
jgi:putative ABC transport system permease protein